MIAGALLQFDLDDWTERSRQLGARSREVLSQLHDAVEGGIEGFNPVEPKWDGDGGKAYFLGEGAAARAVRAAIRAVEQVRSHPDQLSLRATVAVDLLPEDADPSKETPPDWCRAGHVHESICPAGAVCVTEDAYGALKLEAPDLIERFACLGTTRRDRVRVFSTPPRKPKSPEQLLSPQEDVSRMIDKITLYYSTPPSTQLRFYRIPQFDFIGSLDLLRVFTPLRVRPYRPVRHVSELLPQASGDEIGPSAKNPEAEASIPFEQALGQDRVLIVLGEPGSGKTTLLRYLAAVTSGGRFFTFQKLGIAESLVPFLVSASDLAASKEGPLAVLAGCLSKALDLEKEDVLRGIRESVESGRALFLIDGMDEPASRQDRARAAEIVERLRAEAPGSRLVVTSRIVGYPGPALPGAREWVLEPLEAEAAKKLACALYTEFRRVQGYEELRAREEGVRQGEDLVGRLAGSLPIFAGNPLLLSLAALVHIQLGELPRYRVRLYDVAVRTLVEAWAHARKLPGAEPPGEPIDYDAEGRAILSEFAWTLHTRAGDSMEREKLIGFLKKRLRDPRDAEGFLQRLEQAGSILRERGPGRWGFIHLTFQEYLTAKYLCSQRKWAAALRKNIFRARWEEVFRLAAGELGIIKQMDRDLSNYLRTVLRTRTEDWRATDLAWNTILAALCSADTVCGDRKLVGEIVNAMWELCSRWPKPGGPFFDHVFHSLRGSEVGSRLAERLFEALENPRAAPGVLSEEIVGIWLLEGLGAIPVLRHALREAVDWRVRGAAAGALGRLAAKEAIPDLLRAFREDEFEMVRSKAAEALGLLAAKEAIPDLRRALWDDKNSVVRIDAAEALGRLAAKEAIPDLLRALRADKDGRVRWGAAEALGRLAAKEAIPDLLRALREDKNGWARGAAAEALGRLAAKEAIPDLLRALREDKNDWARGAAAGALGRLAAKEAIPDLRRVLGEDEDAVARWSAAEALGRLAAKEAIPDLLRALREDKNGWARGAAAGALGRLAAKEAIPDLRRVLGEDEDAVARWSAAGALGRLAAKEAIPDLQRALREDKDAWVRGAAADALWSIARAMDEPA